MYRSQLSMSQGTRQESIVCIEQLPVTLSAIATLKKVPATLASADESVVSTSMLRTVSTDSCRMLYAPPHNSLQNTNKRNILSYTLQIKKISD